MKKSKTESIQYQPYVTINHERVRPFKNCENFTYLGKDFNFNMNCDHLKKKFNENYSWLYQQNRYFTNSSLMQNRDMPKLQIQIEFIYLWPLDSYLNQLYRKWLQLDSHIFTSLTHGSHIFKCHRTNSVWTSKVQKSFTMNVNYQFVEYLKRHPISNPENKY